MPPPILYPASPWQPPRSDVVVLWHGCTSLDERKICDRSSGSPKGAINPLLGRADTDFGRGFYLTSVERQARQWAWIRYYSLSFAARSSNQPYTLQFTVPRDQLARLNTLQFATADFDAFDYWSLVARPVVP